MLRGRCCKNEPTYMCVVSGCTILLGNFNHCLMGLLFDKIPHGMCPFLYRLEISFTREEEEKSSRQKKQLLGDGAYN